MNTVTIWLLISVGMSGSPVSVVERFVSEAECSRVQRIIADTPPARGYSITTTRCIQANVVR